MRLRVCEKIMTACPKGQSRWHFHSYVRLRVTVCPPVPSSNLVNQHRAGSPTSQFCVSTSANYLHSFGQAQPDIPVWCTVACQLYSNAGSTSL